MADRYVITDWKRLKALGWNVPEGGVLPPRPKAPPAPPKPPIRERDQADGKR